MDISLNIPNAAAPAVGCRKVGCQAPAAWMPILQLWARAARDHQPAEVMLVAVLLCDAHAGELEADPGILLDDDDATLWTSIVDAIRGQGKLPPDRDAVRIRLVPVKGGPAYPGGVALNRPAILPASRVH